MKQENPIQPLRSFGFSAVEAIVVILAVVAVGLSGWRLYRQHSTGKHTSSSSQVQNTGAPPGTGKTSTTTLSSADGNISIKLPNNWQIKSPSVQNKATVIGPGSAAACINSDDPNPCLYQADFVPATLTNDSSGSLSNGNNPASNNTWSLRVEKTRWNMTEAVAQVGTFNQSDIIAQNDDTISGYPAHFLKGYYGRPHSTQSGIAFYVIEHSGYLAVFEEHIQPVGGQTNPITLDSPYDAEFAKIAQSIRFNF